MVPQNYFDFAPYRNARKTLVTDLPEKLQRLGIDSKNAEEERALLLDKQRTVDLIEMVLSTIENLYATFRDET